MIQQWQSEYDTATVKKSFHEIDFERLARKYIPRDNEVELEKSITTSGMSLKAETKYVIGRNIRILRKCLLPEVELLENRHLLTFLNNIIKFTKIEHLYLLSTPEVQFSSQISPNVHFSARRMIRLVSDIHLMYSFADSQKGDDFRKAKNLFEYIINVLKKDFCPLIAKHHRSPPKDKSNYSLLEYLIQLNAHLENFDRVLDHKEYTKICSEMGSMTNFEDNSFTRHSPILKGEKIRSNYSSVSHTEGLSDKSTSSYLSTESNSLRNKMRERREILGHSHMQAFGHSRIASTSFEQMPGSLLSSGVSLTKGEPVDNAKNASTITVEYVKNIQMYSRTLGDLKQYKELKGLKLINEIDVFPKLEDEESRKKNSPLKQRIIKLREEEQNLDPFSMLEIGQLAGKEIKVTVTEPHRQLLKTWEEAKRREEEEQKLFEEQKRLAEKRRKAEKGKDQKDDESNSEDDEQHFREVKKIEFQRSRTIVAKDIEEDEHNLIMHTFQSSPDSSPAIKINNYTFYRSETLEYQIPAMDYLEKTEKVIELPSEFAEEENIDDYCYKKGSSRRQFLTKLFGEKTRQKLYQDLDDIYSSSPIKTSESNGLTEDLINQLRDGLENKKIKKLAKAGASKESVFFLQKQRQIISTEMEVEKKEEEVKKKDKKGNRASVMWAKLRFAVIMRAFAKRLNGKEISFVNFRTKKLLAYLTQNLNNETKEESKMKNGYSKAPTKPIGRIIKRKETGRIFSSFQGSFLVHHSDKGEIDV